MRKWNRRLSIGASRQSVFATALAARSEEHTSELQSLRHLVCRLLLEKKNVVSVHPAGAVKETNEPGIASVNGTPCASLGPAFDTVIGYVRFVPAVNGTGESVLVTDR